MFAVLWRHNANSPWNMAPEPLVTEADARAKINTIAKYDMAKREYRIAPLGAVDDWHDPFAEQEAREAEAATGSECDCGGPFVGKPESYHMPTCAFRKGI